MSKEQMLIARELIKEKQYDEARAILENIDHPKAKEWLQNLDKIAPATGKKSAPAPRQAAPKAKVKPIAEPARKDDDSVKLLDEMMARKRPAQRRPVAAKAIAQKRKKRSPLYFVLFAIIFFALLAGMLFAAISFLEGDEDPQAESTANAITTQNAIDLMTLTAGAVTPAPDTAATEEP